MNPQMKRAIDLFHLYYDRLNSTKTDELSVLISILQQFRLQCVQHNNGLDIKYSALHGIQLQARGN